MQPILNATDRRFSELPEAGAWRSAAGAEDRGSHGHRKRCDEKFQPALASESERGHGCDHSGQILPGAVPDRSLSHGCLADTTLTGRGFFHLGPHGVQVVAGRDHREQQNECAAESAHEDDRACCRTIRTGRRIPLPPQQPSGQQQREPTEIKKKLHTKYPGRLVETLRP